MDGLLKKLQYRGEGDLVVLGAPPEFADVLERWRGDARVVTRAPKRVGAVGFVLRFVSTCAQIEEVAGPTAALLEADGLLWFAYPKKSSRRLTSDIGRDDSWAALGALGFEGVRQVAIDDDWSALRFRRAEFIAAMTRDVSRALSETGKARTR